MAPPPPCSPEQDHPGTHLDWILLGFAIAASVPFVCANGVVLWFRNKKYFQAQGGAPLILAGSTAGLLWIAASFVIHLHFPRKGALLKACPIWSFWLFESFGFLLWLVSLILRLYRLYILCTTSAPPNRLKTWNVYFLVLWSPAFIFSIVASARHGSTWKGEDDICANCHLKAGWKLTSFLILPLFYFSIVVILLFHLKGQKDYLLTTEYRHTSEYSVMAFVIYLLSAVTFMTHSQRNASGRCFLTFCVCCLVFLHFWVRMGRPVYLCLFKRQSEMDDFEDKLRWCGAECFDNISSAAAFRNATTSIPSSQRHDGDWFLRAIDAAMVEASECKEMIDQLEQKKSKLNAKIREREQLANTTPLSSPSTARTIQLAQIDFHDANHQMSLQHSSSSESYPLSKDFYST